MSKVKKNKIPVAITKRIKLTKISDDEFNGQHPNGINEGYTKTGDMLVPPTVGERFWLGRFSTSPVVKVISKTKFKTVYSTYQIEYL